MLYCFPLSNHRAVPGMSSSQMLTYLNEPHNSKIKMQRHQRQNASLYKASCERNQLWKQKSGWYLLVTETGTGSIGGLFLLIQELILSFRTNQGVTAACVPIYMGAPSKKGFLNDSLVCTPTQDAHPYTQLKVK